MAEILPTPMEEFLILPKIDIIGLFKIDKKEKNASPVKMDSLGIAIMINVEI